MTDRLKPYPKYKDSGIPWLGQIPAHWDVRRNGRLFAQRNETGFGELPILEVSLRTGVRVRDMDNLKRKQVMSDAEKYKRAGKGDIAYNMMRMWQGALGTAPVEGLVSPAYVVARPFEETNPYYFSYLFRTEGYKAEVDAYSRGIVKDRNRLYWQDFKRMPSCFPPPEEQAAIVRFLDANAALVRQYTRNRKQLIHALKQQDMTFIDLAITRGLDSHVKMKSSGVDWFPEVPEHWEVKRLCSLASVSLSGVDKVAVAGEQPVKLCNYVDVYHNDQITSDLQFMDGTASKHEIEAFTIEAGDVFITKDSEDWKDIAVSAYAPQNLPGVVCGYHLAQLRPYATQAIGSFLAYCFRSDSIANQFRLSANGVTRYGLSLSAIKQGVFPVPPLKEQASIAQMIQKHTESVNRMIAVVEEELRTIEFLRNQLIADVVAGRIDIRPYVASDFIVDELQHSSMIEGDSADETFDDEEVTYGDD
jgi:type I restriction enzyme S subunit